MIERYGSEVSPASTDIILDSARLRNDDERQAVATILGLDRPVFVSEDESFDPSQLTGCVFLFGKQIDERIPATILERANSPRAREIQLRLAVLVVDRLVGLEIQEPGFQPTKDQGSAILPNDRMAAFKVIESLDPTPDEIQPPIYAELFGGLWAKLSKQAELATETLLAW